MHPGLQIGQTITLDIDVTPDMRAHFNNHTVHDLYSTAAMLNNMEWAARQHLLPYFQPDEVGVGVHMDLYHLAPTPVGAIVQVTALVTGIMPHKVICQCTVFHQNRLVGHAKVVQALLQASKLHDRIPPLSAR